MALPNVSNGFILPLIKFDAKAGKFRRRDRDQRDGQWVTSEAEIPMPFAFIADFQSLEIGWTDLHRKPPSFVLVPYPLDNQVQGIAPKIGPQPSDTHKSSFRMLVAVKLNNEIQIRHFGSSAQIVYRAFSALHDQFLAQAAAHELTMAPVIQIKTVSEIKGNNGINYEPHFEIVKWVPRPEAFNDHLPAADPRGDAWTDESAALQGEGDAPPPGDNDSLPF